MKNRHKPREPQKITYGGRVYWQEMKKGKTCGNKVPHVSMKFAEEAAKLMEDQTGQKFNAYFCNHCHKYHIGRDHTALGEAGYDGENLLEKKKRMTDAT